MKYRIYAYIHLMVLVFYLIRPVLPNLEYAVNKEYIAKNLCVNRDDLHSCCEGKCYLEKQVKKSSESNNSSNDKNNNKKLQNEEVREFPIPHFSIPNVIEIYLSNLIHLEMPVIERYISTIFVPPKPKLLRQ